jgi:hypothetical protein
VVGYISKVADVNTVLAERNRALKEMGVGSGMMTKAANVLKGLFSVKDVLSWTSYQRFFCIGRKSLNILVFLVKVVV